jgi:hypothetical protein
MPAVQVLTSTAGSADDALIMSVTNLQISSAWTFGLKESVDVQL